MRALPHTMVSALAAFPHTIVSNALPQTIVFPQTIVSALPQTMVRRCPKRLCYPTRSCPLPQTIVSLELPQTMVSAFPQTMVSPLPQTIVSPLPHTMVSAKTNPLAATVSPSITDSTPGNAGSALRQLHRRRGVQAAGAGRGQARLPS